MHSGTGGRLYGRNDGRLPGPGWWPGRYQGWGVSPVRAGLDVGQAA